MKNGFLKICNFFSRLISWVKRADTNGDGILTKTEITTHVISEITQKIEKENNK